MGPAKEQDLQDPVWPEAAHRAGLGAGGEQAAAEPQSWDLGPQSWGSGPPQDSRGWWGQPSLASSINKDSDAQGKGPLSPLSPQHLVCVMPCRVPAPLLLGA